VDVLAHFFEALFVGDAKALLFVNDEDAEVVELHVFGKQAMSTDDDIDFAGFEIGESDLLLSGAAKAAEHIDTSGKSGETFLEGLEVLESENCRGS